MVKFIFSKRGGKYKFFDIHVDKSKGKISHLLEDYHFLITSKVKNIRKCSRYPKMFFLTDQQWIIPVIKGGARLKIY